MGFDVPAHKRHAYSGMMRHLNAHFGARRLLSLRADWPWRLSLFNRNLLPCASSSNSSSARRRLGAPTCGFSVR